MIFLDNHEKIFKECEGCLRIFERKRGSTIVKICGRCPYPKMEWIFGECNHATHTNRKELEDPIKEP